MKQASGKSRDDASSGWLFSRGTLVACITLTTVGILLLTGHKAHLLGFAPYLLLLACPLMHLFMHGSHGAHRPPRGTDGSHDKSEAAESHATDER
jgi:hypothetical protein